MTPKLHHIFPESCLLIVVGIIIGFLLFLTSEHPPSTLTPNIFFLFMLPPIILDAGYFMPNRLFFDHLGTILLMAVVGTIFNVITIGKITIEESRGEADEINISIFQAWLSGAAGRRESTVSTTLRGSSRLSSSPLSSLLSTPWLSSPCSKKYRLTRSCTSSCSESPC